MFFPTWLSTSRLLDDGMLVHFRFRDVRLIVVVESFAPRERMQQRTVESLLPTCLDVVEYLFV